MLVKKAQKNKKQLSFIPKLLNSRAAHTTHTHIHTLRSAHTCKTTSTLTTQLSIYAHVSLCECHPAHICHPIYTHIRSYVLRYMLKSDGTMRLYISLCVCESLLLMPSETTTIVRLLAAMLSVWKFYQCLY